MHRLKTLLLILLLITPSATFAETETDPTSEIHLAALKNYRKQFSPDGTIPLPVEKISTPPVKKVAEAPGPTLNLEALVQNVVKHNQELQLQAAEWGISKLEAEKAAAIFEPDFVSSLKLQRNSQKNTIEESLSRQLASTYSERNWDFSTSLEGLLQTGGEFNLGYDFRYLSNSVTRS